MDPLDQPVPGDHIAIIGMAGRFPGAKSVNAFWQNVRDGVESIVTLSDEDLASAGVSPEVASDPGYVRARAVCDDVDLFDAAFFGMTPREAEILDPQHRFWSAPGRPWRPPATTPKRSRARSASTQAPAGTTRIS
jgi:phthiocerol/phenolphthiocerol synthesis type-I polyketide synthase E